MSNKLISDMVGEILAVGSISKGSVEEHLTQLKNPFDVLDYISRVRTFIGLGFRDTGVVRLEAGLDYHLLELQQEAIKEARQMAEKDSLTGLPNHSVIVRGDERRTPKSNYSIMMFDIDRFKRLNDTYGHISGDVIIKNVARILQENLRESFVGRYGGEEFYVELNQTDKEGGKVAAERVRTAVEEMIIESVVRDLEGMHLPVPRKLMRESVTLSVGIADEQQGEDPYHALDRADKALYVAKRCGRDMVVLDGQDPLKEFGYHRRIFVLAGNGIEYLGTKIVDLSDNVKNMMR
jgi:diguanylate cyclase (GGDEF)-like protein